MKKNRGIVVLLLTVLVTVFFCYTAAVGIGPTGTGSAKNIKKGLDLSGGVSITYQTKDKNPSSADMADTVYKLQKRVEQFSTEANAYQEGLDRITVEIPGATDANAVLSELGKPGSLCFIDGTGSDGESNFSYDSTTGTFVLDRTLEEIREAGSVVLEGSDIAAAEGGAYTDQTTKATEYAVSLTMTDAGKDKFATATTANVGKQIAIVYDGEILSAPTVKEAITGGSAQIDGQTSIEEAKNLASFIRIGSLSLELEELRSNVVAAQLGQNAISSSLKAGAIGLLIVILFMIWAYRIPGFVAGLSLIIYTALMLLSINAFDITLTLPGIAGIILDIGMAVDANVIIYARIKEEIAAGVSVRNAIRIGFQKAFSAIFDGNITTLIAALVLMWLGSGSVKGFAYTLTMGIIISMFTALVVSRLIINAMYAVGFRDEKYYGRAKERTPIDFIGKRKLFFIISAVLVLAAPVTMFVNKGAGNGALNYSLEFAGGTSTTVTFNEDMDIDQIDSEITPLVEKVTGDSNVQPTKVQGSNEVIIKTRTLSVDERTALTDTLVENFGVDPDTISSESISATISDEMRSDAIVAVCVATICMLLYIWFRFKDIRFAGSAVLALVHDVLVVLAFYALARVSVGNTFIACMLTIVGYSINATIVIFDRIRENLNGRKSLEGLEDVINSSITQTLTRSIYTSLTTFIMVFMLYLMGVSSIREFALPLMVGILCGAYSSVCITGAVWYVMRHSSAKKQAAAAAAAVVEKSAPAQKKVKVPSGNAPAKTEPKKKNRKRVQERLAREAEAQKNSEE